VHIEVLGSLELNKREHNPRTIFNSTSLISNPVPARTVSSSKTARQQ